MKWKLISVLAATGVATCAFSQQILLDNLNSTGGLWATSGGLVYAPLGSYPYSNNPGAPVPFDGLDYNLGVSVYAGSSAGSLTLIGTYTPANDPKGYTGAGPGQFALGDFDTPVTVPGVAPGGLAYIELQIWDYDSPYSTGTFQSFSDALAHFDNADEVIFANPTGGPLTNPPTLPPDLVDMPSVLMVSIPEPAVQAFAGFGLAALLAFRRR